jgi:hypothetical protein
MNRIFKSALALAAVGAVTNAAPGDNEWLELDSEINGLSSALQPSQDGMGWAALIRAVYTHSSDEIVTGGAGFPDTSGFNFNDIDLAFWGNQGPYMWRVSADLDGNAVGTTDDGSGGGDTYQKSLDLEDAFIRWNCGGYFDAQMGNFKPMTLRSANVAPENQLFIDRTVLGSALDFWNPGISVGGNWESQLDWTVALMNGTSGHDRDHLYVLHLAWALGAGAGMYEGAVGSTDQLNATIGFTWLHDDGIGNAPGSMDGGDHDVYLLDFNGSVSNVGFGFEVADVGEDVPDFGADSNGDFSFLDEDLFTADSKPWNVTVSYLVNPEWEFGVRWENLDNGGTGNPDNEVLSVVANWLRGGNAGKWQIQWTDVSSADMFAEGSLFEVGYSIGSTN